MIDDHIIDKCILIESNIFINFEEYRLISKKGYIITKNSAHVISLCKNGLHRDYIEISNDQVIFKPQNNNINMIVTKNYSLWDWKFFKDTYVFFNFESLLKWLANNNKDDVIFNIVISENMIYKHINYFSEYLIINRLFIDNISISNVFQKQLQLMKYSFMWMILPEKNTLTETTLKSITVEDDDKEIVPENICEHVYCKKTFISSTLHDLIKDVTIHNDISNIDISLTLQHLSSKYIQPENRIVEKLVSKLKSKVDLLEFNEILINENKAHNLLEKEVRLNNIKNKKQLIISKIEQIQQRILLNEYCFICYSDFENKTILKCCCNAVCFICINKWLSTSNKCPLCKSLNPEYYIVSTQNDMLYEDNVAKLSNKNTIFENFIVLIRKIYIKENQNLLILGDRDCFIYNFISIMNHLRIPFVRLHGNTCIHRKFSYKNKILIMNCKKNENGVVLNDISNIIMIEDIDVNSQVVNKCKGVKHIWKLLYI